METGLRQQPLPAYPANNADKKYKEIHHRSGCGKFANEGLQMRRL